MSTGSTIGERLKQVRNRERLTAKELAGRSGVPEKTIYRIETGEVKDPRLSSIKPLLKHLNCTADEILFGPEEYKNLGALKQVFLNASELHESNRETLIDVARAIILYDALQTSQLVPAEK